MASKPGMHFTAIYFDEGGSSGRETKTLNSARSPLALYRWAEDGRPPGKELRQIMCHGKIFWTSDSGMVDEVRNYAFD